MYQIIPGILETEWKEIEKKIEIVRPFAKVVHIDIIDGKFAPTTTFLDPEPFKKYTQDMFFEVHMMVDEPINYIKPFADAGFRRFLGHVEKMSDQVAFVAAAEEVGEVGLVLDGPTDLDALKVPHIDLDTVMIMTIKAGASHQSFHPELLGKVKELTKDTGLFTVEVDGGITEETLVQAWQAGARRFVSTHTIFTAENPEAEYKKLHSICDRLVEEK